MGRVRGRRGRTKGAWPRSKVRRGGRGEEGEVGPAHPTLIRIVRQRGGAGEGGGGGGGRGRRVHVPGLGLRGPSPVPDQARGLVPVPGTHGSGPGGETEGGRVRMLTGREYQHSVGTSQQVYCMLLL